MVENFLKGTEEISKVITLKNPLLLFVRRHFMKFLLSFKSFKDKIVEAISELNIGYPEKRMPNIALNYKGELTDYFSVSQQSTKYHLILFNISDPPINHPQIETVHAKGAADTKAILVRPDGYICIDDKPPFNKLKKYII